MTKEKGVLYLIPTPIGDTPPELVMPAGAIQRLQALDHLIVEDLRTARRLLSKTKTQKPIDSIRFYVLNKHTTATDASTFLNVILEGNDMGLVSEAGSPCVADPGAIVVSQAHQLGIRVVPLSGPSSVIMALMASGFNGQNFAFNGYLPIHADTRNKKIRELERLAESTGQTQIFIETPFRNNQLLEALLRQCQPETPLCISTNISLPNEMVVTKTINDWKKSSPDLQKKPTVFLLWKK